MAKKSRVPSRKPSSVCHHKQKRSNSSRNKECGPSICSKRFKGSKKSKRLSSSSDTEDGHTTTDASSTTKRHNRSKRALSSSNQADDSSSSSNSSTPAPKRKKKNRNNERPDSRCSSPIFQRRYIGPGRDTESLQRPSTSGSLNEHPIAQQTQDLADAFKEAAIGNKKQGQRKRKK